MPTDGQVGGGHQNRYFTTGFIKTSNYEIMKYHKHPQPGDPPEPEPEDPSKPVKWDDPRCWNAGTPVEWDETKTQSIETARRKEVWVKTKVLKDTRGKLLTDNGKPFRMLATTDSKGKIHYHPLIQFFNQVTADLINDNMLDKLRNVQNPEIAWAIWKYLDGKYLQGLSTRDVKTLLDAIEAMFPETGSVQIEVTRTKDGVRINH